MKKTLVRKNILALVIALAMTASLAACGGGGLTTEDASQCVQVEMDTTYKGNFKGFMDFYSNVTEEDAKAQYDANIEGESDYFFRMYGLTDPEDSSSILAPSEMQTFRARNLYKDIYSRTDYSIASSSKQDDGTFAVKVVVKPINIITLVDDNIEDYFADFVAKFNAVDTESMSDEEFLTWYQDVYAAEYYDTLLDLLEQQIPNIDYLDQKDIVIQVQQDEDGSLFISTEDLGNLDYLLIDYNMQ